MLILTRRVGETIVIGGNIEVTVLAVRGQQAKLGINAPPEMPVHREEVQRQISSKPLPTPPPAPPRQRT